MNSTDGSTSPVSILTPQSLHREAAIQLEIAVRHHRQAALLHDAGDARQAETQAGMAYNHTEQGLQVSGRALKVLLW